MAHITGISTERDAKGKITKVIFDYKKHKSVLRPVLAQLGVESEDIFEKEWNNPNNLSVEELRKSLHKEIESWNWDK